MALKTTPAGELGWTAPPFQLPDANGKMHDLAQLAGEHGTVVAFICNHCPYVIAIAERLADDARVLANQGVNVIAVMSNDFHSYPADSPAHMLAFAQRYGFDFPYLVDESQEVARAFGAVCTPDFFGLNAQGQLQYRGRLDNLRMGTGGEGSRSAELVDAMTQIAKTGRGPAEQVPSMGCSIKWK